MAINHQVVALNASTATSVSPAQAPYETRYSISVQNVDSGITVYLGASNVTSSSYGYKLLAGQSFSVDLLASDQLYAIAASGTPNVAIFAAEV
jgi:hypothetical protein